MRKKIGFIVMTMVLLLCSCTKQAPDQKVDGTEQAANTANEAEQFDEINSPVFYVTENLKLRVSGALTAEKIAVLPKGSRVKILEVGTPAAIDGTYDFWKKVCSEDNQVGWCFSAYLSNTESTETERQTSILTVVYDKNSSYAKQVAKSLLPFPIHSEGEYENTAQVIANEIKDIKPCSFPGFIHNDSHDEPILNNHKDVFAQIVESQGLYIQQEPRKLQGGGHAPEILKLSVEGHHVFVSEINIVDGQVLEYNKIEFTRSGSYYTHGKSSIENYTGKLIIYYVEHIPNEIYLAWTYDEAYTFAAGPDDFLNPAVFALTKDYLSLYAGEYVFDSIEIITLENIDVNMEKLKASRINIGYDERKKCLVGSEKQLLAANEEQFFYFIETSAGEPFYWMFAEGVGFVELKYWFCYGGIACSEELSSYDFDDEHNVTKELKRKYVAFYKKIEK